MVGSGKSGMEGSFCLAWSLSWALPLPFNADLSPRKNDRAEAEVDVEAEVRLRGRGGGENPEVVGVDEMVVVMVAEEFDVGMWGVEAEVRALVKVVDNLEVTCFLALEITEGMGWISAGFERGVESLVFTVTASADGLRGTPWEWSATPLELSGLHSTSSLVLGYSAFNSRSVCVTSADCATGFTGLPWPGKSSTGSSTFRSFTSKSPRSPPGHRGNSVPIDSAAPHMVLLAVFGLWPSTPRITAMPLSSIDSLEQPI